MPARPNSNHSTAPPHPTRLPLSCSRCLSRNPTLAIVLCIGYRCVVKAGNTPASEIRGVFDMNDSSNSGTAAAAAGAAVAMDVSVGGEEDADESFDMLANMPPTPGGGLVANSDHNDNGNDNGNAEESFTGMLGIPDSSPTTPATPAAVAAQQGGGADTGNPRRSPRLAAAAGPSTGGRANRSVGRRGVGVGAGGGVGGASGGGMKTPYSSRRSGRRAGGQALTPGTAASNVDGDDANASFM